ncbi:hypothetical protein E2C01_004436 [Portunus trituberculatus]|uniref:Uncharacterized protein n=1 Tax=Portunus trituberculatus TaxID=210409 RepID=A0A5B7CSD0_PORTR|nr:hypothetical protein [Portunus trituberculatus]
MRGGLRCGGRRVCSPSKFKGGRVIYICVTRIESCRDMYLYTRGNEYSLPPVLPRNVEVGSGDPGRRTSTQEDTRITFTCEFMKSECVKCVPTVTRPVIVVRLAATPKLLGQHEKQTSVAKQTSQEPVSCSPLARCLFHSHLHSLIFVPCLVPILVSPPYTTQLPLHLLPALNHLALSFCHHLFAIRSSTRNCLHPHPKYHTHPHFLSLSFHLRFMTPSRPCLHAYSSPPRANSMLLPTKMLLSFAPIFPVVRVEFA